MDIETVSDLAEEIANWCGIYGACTSDGESDCAYDRANPFCCRVGFLGAVESRIRESVKNDELLVKREK